MQDTRIQQIQNLVTDVDPDTLPLIGNRMDPTNDPIARFIKTHVIGVIPVVHPNFVDVFDNYTYENLGQIVLPPAISQLLREFDAGKFTLSATDSQ